MLLTDRLVSIFLFAITCFLFVFLFFPSIHPSLVTKRRKAHLKRLDRRWTLGGIVNRQQSRGEHTPTHTHIHTLVHSWPPTDFNLSLSLSLSLSISLNLSQFTIPPLNNPSSRHAVHLPKHTHTHTDPYMVNKLIYNPACLPTTTTTNACLQLH